MLKIKKTLDYGQSIINAVAEGRVIVASKENSGRYNGMTIGWGFFGVMWNEEIFLTAIKPKRYTWKVIKESGRFTVNVLDSSYKEALAYFGTETGYKINKFSSGLLHVAQIPGFTSPLKEADLCIECSVITSNNIEPFVLPENYVESYYKNEPSFHTMLYGKVENVYKK
jgi:flavin reductase (DIM6/NTAB) family NADH-FMN oxidoreductase RutF